MFAFFGSKNFPYRTFELYAEPLDHNSEELRFLLGPSPQKTQW
jgi:hypothetical protein